MVRLGPGSERLESSVAEQLKIEKEHETSHHSKLLYRVALI